MTIEAYKISSLFEVRFVDRASGCERPHSHQSLLITAVTGGSLALEINQTDKQLNSGVVAAVGPNVVHCVRAYSSDFKGVYVLEVLGFPPSLEGVEASHAQRFGHLLLYNRKRYEAFLFLCKTLLSSENDSAKVESYATWLRFLFTYRYADVAARADGKRDNSRIAQEIRHLIDRCEDENPPFEQIAQVCGYSKAHCNRLFKRTFNLSIQAYFLNKKAASAKQCLQYGEELSEIAQQCGFYDQAHFCRVFNRIYQVSPYEYRQAIRRADHSCTRDKPKK